MKTMKDRGRTKRYTRSAGARLRKGLCALSLASLAIGAATPAGAQSGVFAPHQKPHGNTYPAWTANWLRFVFDHTFDELTTGEPCRPSGVHQAVYFITPFPITNPVPCNIPRGASLLLPVFWVECSSLEVGTDFGCTDEASCRACAKGLVDPATGLSLTIDGVAVDPTVYRFGSPLIAYNLSSDNIWVRLLCDMEHLTIW